MGQLAITAPRPRPQFGHERRTMPRYSFVASSELTDFSTAEHLAGRVAELSLSGCYVFLRKNPPPVGTELSVRIERDNMRFVAPAKTIYVRDRKGMGVMFLDPPPDQLQILESWLAEIPEEAKL